MSEIISYRAPEALLLAEGAAVGNPEELAREINDIKAMARRDTTTYAIAIGQRLLEARNQLPHGMWTEWLKVNVDYSVRTAENLMGLAQRFRGDSLKLVEGLDVTKAVLLLSVSDTDIESIAAESPIDDMSTRELQAKIKELNDRIRKQQLTIDELILDNKMMKETPPEPDPILKNQLTMLQDAEERHAADLANMEEKHAAELEKLQADLLKAQSLRDAATRDSARNAEERREAEGRKKAAEEETERLRMELQKAQEAMTGLEERVKVAESAAVETMAVEKDIPEDVRQELERLRSEQGEAASVAGFKAGYATVQQGWGGMMQAVSGMGTEAKNRACAQLLHVLAAMKRQVEQLGNGS